MTFRMTITREAFVLKFHPRWAGRLIFFTTRKGPSLEQWFAEAVEEARLDQPTLTISLDEHDNVNIGGA